jgi:type I restriction enzyme, S subunit
VKLKPYPAYKDSGMPWLGKIPVHWEVRRNGRLFAQRVETGFPDLPILEVSLRTRVCVRDLDDTKRKQLMSNREQYKRAARGDIAYNMMRMWQGAVGVVPTDGLVSPAYVVAHPFPEAEGRYYGSLFRTAAYMNEVNKYSHGIVTDRNRLYWDEFKQMPSIFPPTGEQRNIADVLDSHDRTVRRFIRAKRRLIELLNEQKQAIIHRAVTRGLDPTVHLKSSGIDWLGEVPEHWTIRKLKYLTRFDNGFAFNPSDWKSSGVPIIRIQNLNGADDFNYTDRENLPQHLLILPGELLFSWSGNRGTSFGSFIWDHSFTAYLNQHIFKLTGYSLDKKFFYYLLRAVTAHVEEQTHGIIGLVHITKPELGAIAVSVPPREEQLAIAAHLDATCAEIAATIQRAQREINLIREYRTRLIADVVTGKLDVRGVELPALDETAVLDDFGDGEEVAELAEETSDIEAIEEENGD